MGEWIVCTVGYDAACSRVVPDCVLLLGLLLVNGDSVYLAQQEAINGASTIVVTVQFSVQR